MAFRPILPLRQVSQIFSRNCVLAQMPTRSNLNSHNKRSTDSLRSNNRFSILRITSQPDNSALNTNLNSLPSHNTLNRLPNHSIPNKLLHHSTPNKLLNRSTLSKSLNPNRFTCLLTIMDLCHNYHKKQFLAQTPGPFICPLHSP